MAVRAILRSVTAAVATLVAVNALPAGALADPSPAASAPWLAYQSYDGENHIRLVRADGSDDHLLVDGSHPDWSPDGRSIAYQVDDLDIWTIGVDGSDPRRVFDCADPCAIGDSAAWSPDGSWLAFLTADATPTGVPTGRILAVNVDTGEQRTLVTTQGPDYPSYPRWSPDGRSMVLSIESFATTGFEDCTPTGSVIAVASVDAPDEPLRILTDKALFGDYPDWSPDGSTIVFNTFDQGRRDFGCLPDLRVPSDVYTIHPDGSELTQLTRNQRGTTPIRPGPRTPNGSASGPLDSQPSWTSDGRSIVFTHVTGQTWPGFEIWTMDPDGGNARPVGAAGIPVVGSHARFQPVPDVSKQSPNPTDAAAASLDPTIVGPSEPWIAYEWSSPEAGKPNAVGIRLIRPDGSGDHWVTTDAPIGGGANADEGWQVVPDWSPDGKRIAFAVDYANESIGTRDIWIADADGSNERRVYDCIDPCLAANDASWTDDGRSLIFVAWDHVDNAVDGSRIERLDLASGALQAIATTSGSDYFRYPRFSVDGTKLVTEIDHWSSSDDASGVFVNSWIALVDLSTAPATIRPLTQPSMNANYPDWHPTQDLIVFVGGTPDAGEKSDLYTIKPDGTDQRLLLHEDSRRLAEPSWLPDGSGVIFVGVVGSGFDDPRMYTVAGDGTGFAPATSGGPPSGSHPRMRPLPETGTIGRLSTLGKRMPR